MIRSSKKSHAARESEQVTLRVRRVLEVFQILPDEALVERRVVSAVLGRSSASTWRDAAQGRLAQPVHIGRSARWRVGDVRLAMKGGSHD
jgi:predicted DNA-binding transcriptional regulator AlpA